MKNMLYLLFLKNNIVCIIIVDYNFKLKRRDFNENFKGTHMP